MWEAHKSQSAFEPQNALELRFRTIFVDFSTLLKITEIYRLIQWSLNHVITWPDLRKDQLARRESEIVAKHAGLA